MKVQSQGNKSLSLTMTVLAMVLSDTVGGKTPVYMLKSCADTGSIASKDPGDRTLRIRSALM